MFRGSGFPIAARDSKSCFESWCDLENCSYKVCHECLYTRKNWQQRRKATTKILMRLSKQFFRMRKYIQRSKQKPFIYIFLEHGRHSEEVTNGIEKIQTENHPRTWFFAALCMYLILSGYMESCLSAQKSFLLFKGPGGPLQNFKNRRKCRVKGLSINTTDPPPPSCARCF